MARPIEMVGKGKYEVVERRQFVLRDGTLVRDIWAQNGDNVLVPIGRAFFPFDCVGDLEEMRSKIPAVRFCAQLNKDLEIYLSEEPTQRFGFPFPHLATAMLPWGSNRQTAEQLSMLLSQTSQFRGKFFASNPLYKEDGRWMTYNIEK